MRKILEKPYIFYLIGIFLLYIILAVVFSKFYFTIKFLPYYLNTINWSELIISIILTIIIALLVSLNSVYSYIRFKQKRNIKKETSISCAATIVGLSTGVCPACVAGVFPLVLSLIGISFTWASLPFKGLEIQLLIIIVLLISLYLLNRRKR